MLFITARLDVTLKITEQHLIVRIGKFDATVTNDKNCARGIVLLKLTRDKREASRGLSVTAKLLVSPNKLTNDTLTYILQEAHWFRGHSR